MGFLPESLKAAFEAGSSAKELATEFSISAHQIEKLARQGGWTRKQLKEQLHQQIRAYYESRDVSLEDLATRFKVDLEALKKVAKTQQWEANKAAQAVQAEMIKDELTQHQITSFLGAKKDEIKQNLKEGLRHISIDPAILESVCESGSDALLLQAMNLNTIHKNILLAALIAKDELLRMHKESLESPKANPTLIAAAEKVGKIFEELKTSLYGKDVVLTIEATPNDLSTMSTAELIKIAKQGEEE